jgi:hypothetical protein
MGKAPANDIFAAYRYDMQARGIKPHSMVTYDRVVGLFGDFLVDTGMSVDDVRRPDVQRFLMETGWAPSAQRTALAYLRVPGRLQPRGQRLQRRPVFRIQGRMCLRGRGERLGHAHVQLLAADPEPAAAARRQAGRLVHLGQLQQPAVEAAGGRLAAGRRRHLHVVDAVITP